MFCVCFVYCFWFAVKELKLKLPYEENLSYLLYIRHMVTLFKFLNSNPVFHGVDTVGADPWAPKTRSTLGVHNLPAKPSSPQNQATIPQSNPKGLKVARYDRPLQI